MKIEAEVVADSFNEFGDRITSMVVTMPRFILAEFNTHRMFSRNSASSRAIPFKKMVKMVQESPFLPYAWQKDHKGMQGTEYLDDVPANLLDEKWIPSMSGRELFNGLWAEGGKYSSSEGTALYHMVNIATELNKYGVTKQIANRLLEPFMWHKVLVTSTEWENFFHLRCPQYEVYAGPEDTEDYFCSGRSWKDFMKSNGGLAGDFDTEDLVERLNLNKGKAEIHMMFLAEAMWDALNESKPRQLRAGEWHIPYESKIPYDSIDVDRIKVSTGMAARVSYTTVGEEKEINFSTLTSIHDKMAVADPFHASPFEHCAKSMSEIEYLNFSETRRLDDYKIDYGWCRNFKGFIQYRYLLEMGRTI